MTTKRTETGETGNMPRLAWAALPLSFLVAMLAACVGGSSPEPATVVVATVLVEKFVDIPVEVVVTREVPATVEIEVTRVTSEVQQTVEVEVIKVVSVVAEVEVTREVPVPVELIIMFTIGLEPDCEQREHVGAAWELLDERYFTPTPTLTSSVPSSKLDHDRAVPSCGGCC